MLARALFIPLSFPLLALSCYCWAGNGLVDNITPDMPTPGGTSPVGTKGIRYIAMKYGPYGQPEHYKTYQLMFSHYSTTTTRKVRYLGELYTVVGDIYLIDPAATTNEWQRGRSQIVEEYYEILDTHGNRTGKGLRFNRWDRPINITNWSTY